MYGSLVTKFKHINIIPLQNFSYEIYLHFLFSGTFSEHVLAISMALLKYLKPAKDRLPDPRGSLAASVPSRAVAQANLEVQQLLSDADSKGKNEVLPISKYSCVLCYIVL